MPISPYSVVATPLRAMPLLRARCYAADYACRFTPPMPPRLRVVMLDDMSCAMIRHILLTLRFRYTLLLDARYAMLD